MDKNRAERILQGRIARVVEVLGDGAGFRDSLHDFLVDVCHYYNTQERDPRDLVEDAQTALALFEQESDLLRPPPSAGHSMRLR